MPYLRPETGAATQMTATGILPRSMLEGGQMNTIGLIRSLLVMGIFVMLVGCATDIDITSLHAKEGGYAAGEV